MKRRITKNMLILHRKCSRLSYLGQKIEEERSFFGEQGIEVNDKAIKFFGAHEEVYFEAGATYEESIAKATSATQNHLAQGKLIAEATFANPDVIVRCDIAKMEKGKLNFIEVKSSKTDANKKLYKYKEYLLDIAAQHVLLEHAGVKIGRASLALLNHEAIGPDAKDLFTVFDVTEEIKPYIKELDLATVIKERQGEVPEQNFCGSCKGCEHFSMCWPLYPDKHATVNIPRIKFEKLKNYHEAGIFRGVEIDPKDLTAQQQLARESWTEGKPVLHTELFRDYHRRMFARNKNIFLLDFEVARPALPLFDYQKPYTQLPFQYSLHTAVRLKNKKLKLTGHKEFLHTGADEPTKHFIESLIRDLNKADYPIIVYSPYEQSVLRDVCRQYPEYTPAVEKIVERFVDIHKAISISFSHPDMNGRTTIKLVLPALSPEFSYDDLEINNGVKAFESWLKIRTNPDPKLEAAMLAYCKRDTEAMFHVLNGIYDVYNEKTRGQKTSANEL